MGGAGGRSPFHSIVDASMRTPASKDGNMAVDLGEVEGGKKQDETRWLLCILFVKPA
jgi:hypothetical protein